MAKLKKEHWVLIAGISVFLFVVVFLIVKRRKVIGYVAQKVWDLQTELQIRTLHPKIRDRVRLFINRADKELGMKLRIPQDGGHRTFQRQSELYAQGRTTGGNIVTYAKAGESYHNYGLAFDVVEMKDGGTWGYKKDYPMERWQKIGSLGKSMGFEWGGDWSGKKTDRPHLQMTYGLSEKQLLAMKQGGQVDGEYVRLVA
jgi:peptidoglycan L-alanyl-D-glutamate endopeptidase CwlK